MHSVILDEEVTVEPIAVGHTYADLLALPEDPSQRHELIDGEHFVGPTPSVAHQRVVGRVFVLLDRYARSVGGEAFLAPLDVLFRDDTVLEPDVFLLSAPTLARQQDPSVIRVVPELVVEVASPSTRAYDLIRKRRVFERQGVATFWFVDHAARRVEVYDLGGSDTYGEPRVVDTSGTVGSSALPGLAVAVGEVLPGA